MSPENYGVVSGFVMHWQQWFMAAMTICNIAVVVTAPTRTRAIITGSVTLLIVYALLSSGFYTGGMVP